MRKLTVCAVAESPLLAQELAQVCSSFSSELAELQGCTPDEIKGWRRETLYVCESDAADRLRTIVPPEQVIVFELRPTTLFFLSAARIPAGARAVVLHSRQAPAGRLIEDCRRLGLTGPDFVPVGLEEQPKEQVQTELQQAEWLLGVSAFVENDRLLEQYGGLALPADRRLVARRTASVHSACRLLIGLLEQVLARLQLERFRFASAHDEVRLQGLAKEVRCVARRVQRSAVQAVVNQVGSLPATSLELPEIGIPQPGAAFSELLAEVDEALWTLHYLKGKLEVMRAV